MTDSRKTAKRTLRLEGHLFPPEDIGEGWTMSIQGSRGHLCEPRADLPVLEDYDLVEVAISRSGAGMPPVDAATLGLPDDLARRFSRPEPYQHNAIAGHLSWEDVARVRASLLDAIRNPNAGIPRGWVGWAGIQVWHGTSEVAAREIVNTGIDMAASSGGYFGHAFYVADEEQLAWSNYADFADEEGIDVPGAVVSFTIVEGASILDLRNPIDWQAWQASGLAGRLGDPGLPAAATAMGIDGVYDRSVGGLAIFNPEVLVHPEMHRTPPGLDPSDPSDRASDGGPAPGL